MIDGITGKELDFPDPIACAVAISDLNSVASRRLKYIGNTIVLDRYAEEGLAAFREYDADGKLCRSATSSFIFVLPFDQLRAAIIAMALPNRDNRILKALRQPVQMGVFPEKQAITDRRLRHQLQSCVITLHKKLVYLKNEALGIETEVSTDVWHIEPELPDEGVSFLLPFHILVGLFDPLRSNLKGRRSSSANDGRRAVYLRYTRETKTLLIGDGSARIVCTVKPIISPAPLLASLGVTSNRLPLSSESLARGLNWALKLGTKLRNVSQDRGVIVAATNVAQLTYRDDEVGQELLVVDARLVKPLQSVLRRLGLGATIRKNGKHHLVEQGVVTIAFQEAQHEVVDYTTLEHKIISGNRYLDVDGHQLVRALAALSIIGAPKARVEILDGQYPQLKLIAEMPFGRDRVDQAVAYVELCKSSSYRPLVGRAFEIEHHLLKKMVEDLDVPLIRIWVQDEFRAIMIVQEHESRIVRAALPVTPSVAVKHAMDDRMATVPSNEFSTSADPSLHGTYFSQELVKATST